MKIWTAKIGIEDFFKKKNWVCRKDSEYDYNTMYKTQILWIIKIIVEK